MCFRRFRGKNGGIQRYRFIRTQQVKMSIIKRQLNSSVRARHDDITFVDNIAQLKQVLRAVGRTDSGLSLQNDDFTYDAVNLCHELTPDGKN
ncbi:MAG: hypothetical protein HY306_04015 [Nitrosomonadales bacterium]|nr:hypothetical protein [Nitrosomonadales bacterium]